MKDLWTLAACLKGWTLGEELWIDGSFLTEKIDPADIDIILVLPEEFHNQASPEQLAISEWWEENDPRTTFGCDTYTLPRAAPTDPAYPFLARQDQYWRQFFGTSRDGDAKGIGRILLPDGCV